MNIEDFKYLALNTVAGWREGFGESILINKEGYISLRPMQSITTPGDIGHPTGFTVDKVGNLYVIDAENCYIYKYCSVGKKFERIMCIGECGSFPWQFRFFLQTLPVVYAGSLALSRSALYVADSYNHRVQAFYLHNYQIRSILGAKDEFGRPVPGKRPGEFYFPKEIVTDSKGNLYVLDRGENRTGGRIQKFNKFGAFKYAVGLEGDKTVKKPENIAVDNDDCIYVIDAGKNYVRKFDKYGQWHSDIGDFAKIKKDFQPSGIAVDNSKLIYIGEKGGVSDLKIHIFCQTGEYLGNFGNYSVECYQISADRNGNLYANLGSPGKIVLLSDQDKFSARGIYYSKMFDSTTNGCEWHRIALDADIEDKTKIDVFYYTSDTPVASNRIKDKSWSNVLISPRNSLKSKDGLFLNGRGRYLWLKIELFGDEVHTPIIRQIKLFFPRISYLRYLPPTYQEDSVGKEFLDRFLSIFESMSYDMEQTIAHMTAYFDPQAVDKEFLNWLASWLGIAVDENWPDRMKRNLIEKAYQLYKLRGTIKGIEEFVRLYTGKKPIIVEHFRLKNPIVLGNNSTIGISTVVGKAFTKRLILEETSAIGDFVLEEDKDPPEKPFQDSAFDFSMFVNSYELENIQRNILERIIQEERPAHTRCFLRMSEGYMKLGVRSFIEIDTVIGKGFSPMRLGDKSYIGISTFLGTKYPMKGTIGIRSKISRDAILH